MHWSTTTQKNAVRFVVHISLPNPSITIAFFAHLHSNAWKHDYEVCFVPSISGNTIWMHLFSAISHFFDISIWLLLINNGG